MVVLAQAGCASLDPLPVISGPTIVKDVPASDLVSDHNQVVKGDPIADARIRGTGVELILEASDCTFSGLHWFA